MRAIGIEFSKDIALVRDIRIGNNVFIGNKSIIMPNERMFRFTKSYMEHEIVRGIKETGVKRVRIHDLRHSHASLLVELGFQPLAIAERLGHEKIETTLNTYSHLYPNKQAELANRLELENEEDNL